MIRLGNHDQHSEQHESDSAGYVSGSAIFRRSLIVAITNPKAYLFFSALLPQFIDPGEPQLMQFLILNRSFFGCRVRYFIWLRNGRPQDHSVCKVGCQRVVGKMLRRRGSGHGTSLFEHTSVASIAISAIDGAFGISRASKKSRSCWKLPTVQLPE